MKKLKKYTIIAVVCATLGFITYQVLFTESVQRKIKDAQSNYLGGLERTCTVYSYNGQVIKAYAGKYDISQHNGGRQLTFDVDGKRKQIFGGIVVCEEN